MLNLFLLSVLVGAVLGMRLKVLILIPAIGFFVIGIIGIGTVRGDGLWLVVSPAILAITCLELGYLAGSTTRFVMAAVHIRQAKREKSEQAVSA
jgi:hypothetical protein